MAPKGSLGPVECRPGAGTSGRGPSTYDPGPAVAGIDGDRSARRKQPVGVHQKPRHARKSTERSPDGTGAGPIERLAGLYQLLDITEIHLIGLSWYRDLRRAAERQDGGPIDVPELVRFPFACRCDGWWLLFGDPPAAISLDDRRLFKRIKGDVSRWRADGRHRHASRTGHSLRTRGFVGDWLIRVCGTAAKEVFPNGKR